MSGETDFFIARFREQLSTEETTGRYVAPRPYRNAVVRFRDCSIDDYETRRDVLVNDAGLNAFLFRADLIPGCDLLSDSGTTTMTMEQWAAMLLGDEAYGSNRGYFELKQQMASTFGPAWDDTASRLGGASSNLFLFHQGRAAENAFFRTLSNHLQKAGAPQEVALCPDLLPELRARIESRIASMRYHAGGRREPFYVVPSNSHFDTTEGNIEDKWLVPLNMPCSEHLADDSNFLFRGNMDVEELDNLLSCEPDRVPLVYLTITNNTGGGQPVSMENIRLVREVTRRHGVPFFFDACRFAENAWFIRKNEPGYADRLIGEIVHEMFEQVDGFHISLKKDGLVNMGGALMIRPGGLFEERYPRFGEELTDCQIMSEGHPTYGGLAGRDLMGIVQGLRTVTTQSYLDSRIGQVVRFGRRLDDLGIPVVQPIGGSAVYIDMDRFFDGEADDGDFRAIAFTALLLIAGHRFCELGLYAFGKSDGERDLPPDPRVNNVRAAVPRLVYEDRDLFAAAEAVRLLHEHRDRIPGVDVIYGRDLNLRHFKSRFAFRR
ncbi:MAG: tryptophanase [Candidatus Krumholzibacteriota bacterium]|nr:tryptophanase [Candidatus Krumholzibacteriota bacterium]